MVWVGRDLQRSYLWWCPGQGPLPPAQAAPSPIQSGLEPCQGGGSHSFSGQPGPVPVNVKKLLPYIQSKPTFFQFRIITPCPVTKGPGKKSFTIFLVIPPLHTERPQSGLPAAFSSPGWAATALPAFPPSRGVPALASLLRPPLAPLPQLQVCPVLRAPELDAGLPGGLSRAGQNPPPHPVPMLLGMQPGAQLGCQRTLLARAHFLSTRIPSSAGLPPVHPTPSLYWH